MKWNNISPHITLAMLAVVGLLSMGLMMVIPEEGWGRGDFRIRFKTWASLWDTTTVTPMQDVNAYLAQLDSMMADSLSTSVDSLQVERVESITSIQFRDGDSSPLFPFFESLHEVRDQGSKVHILHYGDSQIESDRMTGYIRQKFQEQFGGYGPGLVCPVPITASANISQSQSDNWKRYTAYGFDNGKAAHNRYGIMASFGRFTPSVSAAELDYSDTSEAWIELRASGMAHTNSRSWSRAVMYFGYHLAPVQIDLLVGDSIVESRTFPANGQLEKAIWNFAATPKKMRFVFRGVDSPDVQCILLESGSGVYMDNIALRGSNGNIFKRIASGDLSTQLSDLNTRLIILQFGGNSVPYITGTGGAEDYANFFRAQIQYLRTMAPDAAFIVVGPSDMSTSVDGVYQSWPGVSMVRDAMKEAAFAEGCGFWDMYSVMGGTNSMVAWVNNDPPYAGPDHTHFTPLGARKMAEYFYKAIKHEYDAWLAAHEAAEKSLP